MSFKQSIFKFLSRSGLQGLWEFLHLFSLRAMNVGGGADVFSSGEVEALKFAQEKISNQKEIVIFDVGANNGEFSKISKKYFPNSRIFAFEPSKNTFEVLKSNTKDLQNIQIIKLALGDKVGKQNLYSVTGESGLASLYERNLEFVGKSTDSVESVEVTTLDEFCTQNNITEIDYLKLDVEGHELSALRGALDLLTKRKIHYLQFEFGGANIDSKTYFKDFYYLLHKDYNIYRILGHGLAPIKSYKETYEIFITTNYLAVLK